VVDVRVDLVTTIEDTAAIRRPVAGVNRNGDWANGCNCVHQIIVAVFNEFSEARDLNRRCTSWHFASFFNTPVFSIGVLSSSHHASAGSNISESDLSSCTVAVASASALVWVW